MLRLRLDPDLERVLERDVDDLARYNILRYLHDNRGVCGSVSFFADRLGLRSTERVGEALEALARRGLLVRSGGGMPDETCYELSSSDDAQELVERLYQLSSSEFYGEIVERLAARSLHRARRPQGVFRGPPSDDDH